MYSYRVTKYNPQNRDKHGTYILSDWTSVWDIENGRVSREDYIQMEGRYIQFVLDACDILLANEIKVINFDRFDVDGLGKLVDEVEKIRVSKTKILSKYELECFCRDALREQYGGYLRDNEKLYVYFGYDYCMYVISSMPLSLNIKTSLFVEEMSCPYHDE